MKVDYEKFPNIPPNCQLNYNKHTRVYQVFRPRKEVDPVTGATVGRTRDTIGSIKDGVFTPGENYLLRTENQKLNETIRDLKEQLAQQRALVKTEPFKQEIRTAAATVTQKINEIANDSQIDRRRRKKSILIPMTAIATATMMTLLCGPSDAVLIADYLNQNKDFFRVYMPELAVDQIAHDTVRRVLLLAKPERVQDFFTRMTTNCIYDVAMKIYAADGQAVRATGRRTKNGKALRGAYMMMNIFDVHNRVCVATKLIEKKKNEITVGPQMLAELDIAGCVITADAMSCQVRFTETIINQNGHYLISLKGNQDKTLEEVRNLFATAHKDHIHGYAPQESEYDHGRIESRQVWTLPGRFLSKTLQDKWSGLAGGCIVKMRKTVINKTTGKSQEECSYYISSLSGEDESAAQQVYTVLRSHWGVENNLHYMLDMFWRQDQMQASNPRYVANLSMLNKLALAFLEHYRYWLWTTKRLEEENLENISIQTLQARCRDPKVAIECLACGLGLLPESK